MTMILTVVIDVLSSFIYRREHFVIGCHNHLEKDEETRERGRDQ